jgi:biopolymer transport protein ExbB
MIKPFAHAMELWASGGWAMIPLAVNAVILYSKAAAVYFTLADHKASMRRWNRRLGESSADAGTEKREHQVTVGFLAEYAVDVDDIRSIDDMVAYFDEVRSVELPPINRDLRFLKVAISTAPLLGLLGTVTGMFSTFSALSGGSGGKTMDQIAAGISEALITTQTGLMIALPAYFFFYALTRGRDEFAAFLAHMETICTRRIYKEGGFGNLVAAGAPAR